MPRSFRRIALLAALCAALSSGAALAQEAGSALKGDDLRAEPFADAKSVGKVDKGEALTILARKGGWYQVKAGTKSGWVRMLSVRRGAGGKAGAADEIAGVAGVATGRAGTGQVVSTTGVRGLSEADLKQAKFNAEEIGKAEANRVNAGDAKAFAGEGKLEARQVAFLPDPKDGGRR